MNSFVAVKEEKKRSLLTFSFEDNITQVSENAEGIIFVM